MKTANIRELEPNIHAGVSYIRHVIDHYFKDEPMDDLKRPCSRLRPTTRGEEADQGAGRTLVGDGEHTLDLCRVSRQLEV
jgi:hypothetical protein